MTILDDFRLPRVDQFLLRGLREARSPMLDRVEFFGPDTAPLYRMGVERPRQLRLERLATESFEVSRASDLAAQLSLLDPDAGKRIRVVARSFTWDAPLLLAHKRQNQMVVLDFSGVGEHVFGELDAALVQLEGCSRIGIAGLKLLGCPVPAIRVDDGEDIAVVDNVFIGSRGTCVELSAQRSVIENNYFQACTAAAIVVWGGARDVSVRDNQADACCDQQLGQAAIVVSQHRKLLPGPLFQSREWSAAIGSADAAPPSAISVVGNRVLNCRGVSIVIDGAIDVNVAQNELRWGRCEGLVVAGGTVGCRVEENVIADCGRLPAGDHGAAAGTPYAAVLLNNVVLSTLFTNMILRSGYSGISACGDVHGCVFGLNTIVQQAENGAVESSSGIFLGDDNYVARLGARRAGGGYGHYSHNVLFGNAVRGPFRAGITLGEGCRANHLFDNAIFQTAMWSIESTHDPRDNVALNNLSAVRSRNIPVTENLKMLVAEVSYDVLERP